MAFAAALFMPNLQDDLGITLTEDCLCLLFGKLIGRGDHREVYECPLVPNHVIKIERPGARRFANVDEWLLWDEYKNTKWEKWLAPIHQISPCGTILIQRKCGRLFKERPVMVPSFFGDLKGDNWGEMDGRIVCFDYANHKSFQNQRANAVLKKAVWHDRSKQWREEDKAL